METPQFTRPNPRAGARRPTPVRRVVVGRNGYLKGAMQVRSQTAIRPPRRNVDQDEFAPETRCHMPWQAPGNDLPKTGDRSRFVRTGKKRVATLSRSSGRVRVSEAFEVPHARAGGATHFA